MGRSRAIAVRAPLRLALLAAALGLAAPVRVAAQDAGGLASGLGEDLRRRAQSSYVVGPGDVLEIEVFELEELTKTVRVSGDGTISYPVIGVVQVAGLTKVELERKLRDQLQSRYVRDPQVTVFIREMVSGSVVVLGAVTHPGAVSMLGQGTVLEALSRAGGATPDAGGLAYLVRRDGSDPIIIDLRKLMEKGQLVLNLPVGSGDVLYVPQARSYKVYVYGQVERPGVFEVEEGEEVTVLQAVAMAGGLGRRASAGKVKVVRDAEGQKRQTVKVNLDRILKGKAPDIRLREGDIVVVPKSFF